MNFRELKEKLTCPLVSALIQIFFILVLFVQFFEIKDHYYSSISNASIRNKIENRINQCGENYWISWIVLDGNISKNKYYFKDLIGCNNHNKINGDCSYSVKASKLNPFYNEPYHKLDSSTYEFLSNMDTGLVAYFEGDKELSNFSAIKRAARSSNKEIESLGVAVTKNITRNVIYAFTMSKTKGGKETCDKKEVVNILEDLSIFAKEKL